jgi:hypothetical protein
MSQIQSLENHPGTAELVAWWRQHNGPWPGITEEQEARVARIYQLIHEKADIQQSEVPVAYRLPGSHVNSMPGSSFVALDVDQRLALADEQ